MNLTRQALPRIFIFWTGTNELTPNRIKCVENINYITNVNVILITKDNLLEWVVKDYPLHPAYEYLSSVHKADYLRCYFMHHHGGGYTDIKSHTKSWVESFKKLNISNNMIGIGYSEVEGGIAVVKDKILYEEMSKNYKSLIGNCSYIFKPNTAFTKEWYEELHTLLDNKFETLKLNPASNHRDHLGLWLGDRYSNYPLEWSEILGQIFHPLNYKYKEYILNTLSTPDFNNYL